MMELDIEDMYALTPLQEGMLFHALAQPISGTYVVRSSWALESVEPEVLDAAFNKLVARHPVLRTGFFWEGLERPIQVVVRSVELPLERLDLSALVPEQQQARLAERLHGFIAEVGVLDRPPLMRAVLADLGGGRHQLLFSWHHLLLDGWSASLVVADLLALYQAERRGTSLPQPWIRPFRDYVLHLAERAAGDSESLWRARLAGFCAPTPVPFDGEGVPEGGGGRVERSIPRSVRARVEAFARQERVTLNTVFAVSWAMVLARHAATNDVLFGVTVSGRPPELEGSDRMVGLFINTLPLRVNFLEGETVSQLLRRVAMLQAEQRELEHTPLVKVKEWSEFSTQVPLFESLFVFENYPVDALASSEVDGLSIRSVEQREQTSYPIAITVAPQDDICLAALFDGVRVTTPAAVALLDELAWVVEQLCSRANSKVEDLELSREAAFANEGDRWNALGGPLQYASLTSAFAAQVAQRRDAVALRGGGKSHTYGELDAWTSRLATAMRRHGVTSESLVAVLLPRSVEYVAVCVATVKAGAAYVPLDPTLPLERLREILERVAPSLIIVPTSEPREWATARVIEVSALEAQGAADSHELSEPLGQPQLAYVMFTSGSTGKPKGVAVTHAGVLRLALCDKVLRLTPEDVVAHASNVAFDASTFEIWASLLRGASIEVLPTTAIQSAEALATEIAGKRISVLFLTTSVFNRVAVLAPTTFRGLRYLVAGGEAMQPRAARAVLDERLPLQLVNGYGPTEVTTFATYHTVEQLPPAARSVPIGRPLTSTQAYVLDDEMAPVWPGQPGQLWLGGAGLARGYLGQPGLTADRFRPSPFVRGERIYQTGDRVRRRLDGALEFLGRLDSQIKLRGFRIELGEIEVALQKLEGVALAAASLHESDAEERRLVAYVVPRAGSTCEAAALRVRLEQLLPSYMVPSQIVLCDALPVTSHGKLDRAALVAPPLQAGRGALASPRTPREVTLSKIFEQVLRVQQVGLDDSFFGLGGDSIISIQLIARAREQGLMFSARAVFEHPTVRELARAAQLRPRAMGADAPVAGEAPLAPAQRWYLGTGRRDPQHFNMSFLLSGPPQLTFEACREVLEALWSHHDELRARFIETPTGWRQAVLERSELSLERLELAGMRQDEGLAALRGHGERLQRSLDLFRGPCARFAYARLPDGGVRLFAIIHHLVVDMVSWRLLLEDLETATSQVLDGEKVSLPPKTSSFLEFSERLLRFQGTERARAVCHAIESQRWAEVRPLPRDGVGPNTVALLRQYRVTLTAEETRALFAAPGEYGCEANDLMVTALAVALADFSRAPHIGLLVEQHGREELLEDVDLTRTVGWFTTLCPLVIAVDEFSSPRRCVEAVSTAMRSVPERGFGYDPSRSSMPWPEVSWNFLGNLGGLVDTGARWRIADEDVLGPSESLAAERSELLSIVGAVVEGVFELSIGYGAACHREATIAALAGQVLERLRALIGGVASEFSQGCSMPGEAEALSDEAIAATVSRPFALLDRETVLELPAGAQDAYPLTSLQAHMVRSSIATGRVAYQEFFSYHLRGSLDADRLQRALTRLSRRHLALRTIVVAIDGASPLQVVLREPVVKLRIVELGDLDEEAQQCELQQQELRERREGFAFGDVLWRVSAFRRGPETFQLVLVLHHVIVDGWSFATLLAELWTEYQRPGSVPDQVSGPSYGVYVALERAAARSEAAAARWRSLLENAVFSGFPRDLSPELVLTPGEVAVKRFHLHALPAETTSLALALARRLAVPNKSVFLAAWFKWLSLVSGRDDVVSGVVTHGRPELAAAEEQVGCFLNCVPLRMRLAPGSWQALILESAGLEGRVLPDRRFPLAEIERITGQSPLYRAGFNFVQFHVLGGVRGEFEPLESREGNPDAAVEEPLWIEVSVVSDTEATLRVEYSPSVLSLRDAQAFAVGYAEVLSVLARSPQEEHQRWCPAWAAP